ncbi:MAG: alpha/beta hydrolase [Candidatus Zixiibacteriota bacterium]
MKAAWSNYNEAKAVIALALCLLFTTVGSVRCQDQCERIMQQDSTLNNLIDPPGYKTCPLGTLGGVEKAGTGPQPMVLIPGLGFGGDIFRDFMTSHLTQYTMYAVTLPGMGGTPAPPSPPETVSFGEQTWTTGALSAIEKLIQDKGLDRPIVLGHWIGGTQIALRLALSHPERVKAVILVSGSACMVPTDTARFPTRLSLDQRTKATDLYMAPLWFKTVTRETWDDNNFLPGDYAVNPVRGLRLWRQAATPPLHVWVRYLCEFNAQDIGLSLDSLAVPTLLIRPGLEGAAEESGSKYLEGYCHKSWELPVVTGGKFQMVTVPNSRVCLWYDQPSTYDSLIEAFVNVLD